MSDRAKRKEKQRLKRKEKRMERRREKSAGPRRIFSLAANRGLPLECYCNPNWLENGMLSILCLREIPGGHAMAAFLIDTWCMGLKDAWGRSDITHREFREGILDAMSQQTGMEPIDEEEVRRLVAGAVRFSIQNGFRLPPRYDRWTALIGGIGDPAEADLSDFGADGKLRCIASMDDIRRRLIGSSVEEFLGRPDVEFTIGVNDPGLIDDGMNDLELMDDNEDESEQDEEGELDETIGAIFDHAVESVSQWLIANGQTPHPRLGDALKLSLVAMSLAKGETDDELAESADENLSDFLTSFTLPDQSDEIMEAGRQIQEFARNFSSGEEFADALGLPGLEE